MTILPESHPKVIDAYTRGNQYLADANALREAGKQERAERLYTKGQYWLDRYNKLTGRGEE
jgi:hypothetical protein